ncbi:HMA2 domain-containing protein [Megasphaera vaginalis (ex Srinivasan et al. 2021)]|uniref:Uncharacterized protein n=1 Tax=Megasphaera vaginalis (ex Srinivasan et al. 2021) TaxID=1111454 RepID=U7UH61_9FIRM|nr:hypothetical protein [Megasphaera vaginalis (ex Srinivasan et al. 2021)]ERT57803.1 hypothetical protein HMPREF1250_1199 [Megasphaera vaginalis (ex Srinivasan et al. 2021)]
MFSVFQWQFFLRSLIVSSYLPGRIRLHSRFLIGNSILCKAVYTRIASYKEIDLVEVNKATGSVLISYNPAVLRKNADLVYMENYFKNRVERSR